MQVKVIDTIATITIEKYQRGVKVAETKDEEVVKTEQFEQPTATVGLKSGITRNLGDYNSVRVDVHISLPCYVNEIDTVYEYAKHWVDERLNEIVEEIDSEDDE